MELSAARPESMLLRFLPLRFQLRFSDPQIVTERTPRKVLLPKCRPVFIQNEMKTLCDGSIQYQPW